MIKPISKSEQFFALTETDALDKIDEAYDGEHGDFIVGQSVQLKANKNGAYYLVKLDFKFNTPAGIMETMQEDEEEPEAENEEVTNESEEK